MKGNVTQYVEALENGLKHQIIPYDQHNYKFKINVEGKCDSDSYSSMQTIITSAFPIHVVCLVKSAVEHFENRRIIRETWGSETQKANIQIRTVFLLGNPVGNDSLQQSVEEESQTFHDIIQGDFKDEYYNNTIKTLMGLQWATKFCPSKFYFFVDDDYLVSMENLFVFLSAPTNYPVDYTEINLKDMLNSQGTKNKMQPNSTLGTCQISLVKLSLYL